MVEYSSFNICLQCPCLCCSIYRTICEETCPFIAICCFCPCYFYEDNQNSKVTKEEESKEDETTIKEQVNETSKMFK